MDVPARYVCVGGGGGGPVTPSLSARRRGRANYVFGHPIAGTNPHPANGAVRGGIRKFVPSSCRCLVLCTEAIDMTTVRIS